MAKFKTLTNYKTTKLTHLLFLVILFFFSSSQTAEGLSHYVLVSVAPYKFFVDKIAGNTVKTGMMVPAGASAHTYEPTPKEMLAASQADVWFLIGESFESRAVRAIQSHHPSLVLVDLRKGVNLISSDPNHLHHHGCNNPNCQDLHIWLSPRQAQIQARTIADALSELYPENKDLYQANLKQFLAELEQLNGEITAQLQPLEQRTIMVSHPAYAYFARDYNLKQLSIEFEGKDPTPRQLTKVINEARNDGISTIFIQMQYNNKGAKLIANQLGAKIVTLDPYSENYIESMREIARNFAAQ